MRLHFLGAADSVTGSRRRRVDIGDRRLLAGALLIESTCGNRRHPAEHVMAQLGCIVRDTIARGGSVLLPTCAVGRAQALLLVLQWLRRQGQIPLDLPIFADSPTANAATALNRQHGRLPRVEPAEVATLTDGVRMVETAQQSMRRLLSRHPGLIFSAGGMATAGRVLHHLKAMAPAPRHHIVFPGFQVGGSRGAKLVAGDRAVQIHGEFVPVRAEVSHLDGLSGHADADADADTLGWPVRVPQHGERVTV